MYRIMDISERQVSFTFEKYIECQFYIDNCFFQPQKLDSSDAHSYIYIYSVKIN